MAEQKCGESLPKSLELAGATIQLCTAYSLLQEMNKPLSMHPYSNGVVFLPYKLHRNSLLLELMSKIPVAWAGWYWV